MQHGDFVIWMLVFPLVSAASDVIRYRWYRKIEVSEVALGWGYTLEGAMYLGIGYLLF